MIYIDNYYCTAISFICISSGHGVCNILIYNISFPFSFQNITVVCRNLCFKIMFQVLIMAFIE